MTDISILKEHTDLQTLHLNKTCVKDISVLRGRMLQSLDLADTPVTNFSGLEKVKSLYLTDHGLEMKAALSSYTNKIHYSESISTTIEHIAACEKANTSHKVPTGEAIPVSNPTSTLVVNLGNKPMSGGTIALISVSVALVVGGGLYFLYFKQPALL